MPANVTLSHDGANIIIVLLSVFPGLFSLFHELFLLFLIFLFFTGLVSDVGWGSFLTLDGDLSRLLTGIFPDFGQGSFLSFDGAFPNCGLGSFLTCDGALHFGGGSQVSYDKKSHTLTVTGFDDYRISCPQGFRITWRPSGSPHSEL